MTHVKLTTRESQAWCGAPLETKHYVDAEHAALNGLYERKQVICSECIDAIVISLQAGRAQGDHSL